MLPEWLYRSIRKQAKVNTITNATKETKETKGTALRPEERNPKDRESVERASKILAYQLRLYLGANIKIY